MELPGGDDEWLAPSPSPPGPAVPDRHDEHGVGTFIWPPVGTSTWPPVGTFSWPRTTPSRHVGQPIPPTANRNSTRTTSASTVTIGASKHYSAAPRHHTDRHIGSRNDECHPVVVIQRDGHPSAPSRHHPRSRR